jgi:collagen beta-1,O-galactosyltransferase
MKFIASIYKGDHRMRKMEYCFQVLGLDVKRFEAVDGRKLNNTFLKNHGIQQLDGYLDPYHKRGLKIGEIGCFLSHYYIWKEMIEKGYEKVLVLEDDIRFSAGFKRRILAVLREANLHKPDWELLYIGRKRMTKNETFVTNSQLLVYPGYTYWTLGYIINSRGASKLLRQEPLNKLVAVDEYLPILFDKHPQMEWAKHFSPRDLQAISAEPLLLEPTHYAGEMFYVSDTEDSGMWQ